MIELLVGMTVMAVLGIALTRILVNDARFVSRQEAMLSARQVSRAAMNVMAPELRMTSDSGLVAASPDSIVVRMPFAFGMTCNSTGSRTYASMMPPDSLSYTAALPDIGGLAWRDSAGVYRIVTGVTVVDTSSGLGQCISPKVSIVPGGGFAIKIQPVLPAPAGHVFYLFQRITYKFAPSTTLPGRRALWRRVGTGTPEELVMPFDSTARFWFLVGPKLTAVDTVPTNLATIRGLELHLIGASDVPPQGSTEHEVFELIVGVPFTNRN